MTCSLISAAQFQSRPIHPTQVSISHLRDNFDVFARCFGFVAALHGLVRCSASSIGQRSEPPSALLGLKPVRCVTKPQKGSWYVASLPVINCSHRALLCLWPRVCRFAFDISPLAVRPTAYALRHYISFRGEALRSWTLEARSEQDTKWITLASHQNDLSLLEPLSSAYWKLVN